NSTAERFLGKSNQELHGKRIFDELPELFDPDLEARLRRAVVDGGMAHFEHYFAARQRWIELNVYPSAKGGLSMYLSDITEQKKVRTQAGLQGILTICANCKKIREVSGRWQQIESHIRQHSPVEFSHSICPDCLQHLYPEVSKPG